MCGIELRNGTLVVGREPNELDELAITCSGLLDKLGIDHVFVSGYVAILAGRARATEDIDVLVEPFDAETAERLAVTLADRGFWGPAMPLDDLSEVLASGDPIWVAPEGQVAPHLELKFADDVFDRASLGNAITARIGEAELPIGPIELQIAYKLYLGTLQDIEDAVHLFTLLGERLSTEQLQSWSEQLDVEEAYERLERT